MQILVNAQTHVRTHTQGHILLIMYKNKFVKKHKSSPNALKLLKTEKN